MVPRDEAPNTIEHADYFVIQPSHPFWDRTYYSRAQMGDARARRTSATAATQNDRWLTVDQIRQLADLEPPYTS